MRQQIIGTYEFGYEKVQLVLREGEGGEFYTLPGDINCPRIRIGADHPDWRLIVAVLVHEAVEFALERAGARYSAAYEMARDHAAYLFVMDHTRFAEACVRVAEFLTGCLPDLSRAWKKWRPRAGR